jgi:hypothetical protein
MTEWLAWVDVAQDSDAPDGPRIRRYVTHGVPFLQLTPFRSAAARYASSDVARTIASFAAGPSSPSGAEAAPAPLARPPRPGREAAMPTAIHDRPPKRPERALGAGEARQAPGDEGPAASAAVTSGSHRDPLG